MINIEYDENKKGYLIITLLGYIKSFNENAIEFTYTVHRNIAPVFDLETATKYKKILSNIIQIMNTTENQ